MESRKATTVVENLLVNWQWGFRKRSLKRLWIARNHGVLSISASLLIFCAVALLALCHVSFLPLCLGSIPCVSHVSPPLSADSSVLNKAKHYWVRRGATQHCNSERWQCFLNCNLISYNTTSPCITSQHILAHHITAQHITVHFSTLHISTFQHSTYQHSRYQHIITYYITAKHISAYITSHFCPAHFSTSQHITITSH